MSKRTVLPLTPVNHPGRQSMTCQYRCADACSQEIPNTTSNPTFGEIVTASASRRAVLKGSGLGVAVVGVNAVAGQVQPVAAAESTSTVTAKAPFNFQGVPPQPFGEDRIQVPEGMVYKRVISWGEGLFDDSPKFDFDNQTAAAQEKQFGYNNDFVAVFPRGIANKAVMFVNHEYTNDELMFRGYTGPASLTDEQLKVIMAAHGASVVELSRKSYLHPWTYVKGAWRNRRITATTNFTVDGPVANHPLLKTSADPNGIRIKGTLNNCAGGMTPWGTVLSGEENFNQYFKADTALASSTVSAEQKAAWKRYGITSSGRGWERVDSRFDLAEEPNEANRFGWVVEIDPFNPNSTPVKHTALGRFKHEGANVTIAENGKVVCYSGDDERYDYLYKFVSKHTYREGDKAHNMTLLAEGDLYVAEFAGDGFEDGVSDGTGRWIPLVKDGESKVPGMSVAEVLVHTRLAADKVGPTKMDRPEDVEVNPVDNRVYVACTNNTRRQPSEIDEANPRANNKHGHIIAIDPLYDDHTSSRFTWRIVLIAGDPQDPTTYFNGFDKNQVTPISCPDNVAFDAKGDLWIATDGNALGFADGLFHMPMSGPKKGHLQQFLTMPAGAECCGPLISFDGRAVFAAPQHPGEIDGASPDAPKSTFPWGGNTQPRPSVIQVQKANKYTRSSAMGPNA